MKVTVKEKKSNSKGKSLKNMLKNPGIYYNEDSDFYVMSVAQCMRDEDCVLIYLSPFGETIETLDLDAWANDTFVLDAATIKIKND